MRNEQQDFEQPIQRCARKRSATLLLSILTSFVALQNSTLAYADVTTSPYRYGGACGSQGSWTQQALSQTNELKSYLRNIKDDPKCKALPASLQSTLSELETQLNLAGKTANGESGSLPSEIGALRLFMSGTSLFRTQVSKMMTSKLVRKSVIDGSQAPDASDSARLDGANAVTAGDLVGLKERVRSGVNTSLMMIDRTVDALPDVQECMTQPNQFGHFLASTVAVLGSIASSGQDGTGAALARTVSKLFDANRNIRFGTALGTLDRNEFLASLACILDVTSENYCSTRDGQILFNEMNKNSELITTDKGELKLRDRTQSLQNNQQVHPLEGYYVLTQNLPVIADWLQSIQLGVEPRLPTDSQQKNKPLDEINTFYKAVNNLRGTYNSTLETMRQMKTASEQRNLVLKLISNLTMSMGGGDFDGMGAGNQNFFTVTYQPMHIPFRLIGIETPAAVLGSTSGFQQGPDQYLAANFEKMPEFQNPEELAKKIGSNMDEIIRRASDSAITYYNKWIVIDKIAIVNRSVVGSIMNVKESLGEIDRYLYRLEVRIKTNSGDPSMLPGLRDTRVRIEKVLGKFAAVESLGKSMLDPKNSVSTDLSPELLQASEGLIKEVYDQFYVMLAKSGWLANRLVDFVQYDYNLMLRSGLDMTPYVQEIYLATGRTMVNQIIANSQNSPAAVNEDLALALRIGKGNIEALEYALSPSYADEIAFLTQVAKGDRYVDSFTKYATQNSVLIADPIPGNYNSDVWRYSEGIIIKPHAYALGSFLPLLSSVAEYWFSPQHVSLDDEFDSAKRLRNQLCIQTLAFSNLNPFWNMCKNAEMVSPFVDGLKPENAIKARQQLDVIYKDKAWEKYKEDPKLNLSLRICGLREYNRKNLVLYLLQGELRGSTTTSMLSTPMPPPAVEDAKAPTVEPQAPVPAPPAALAPATSPSPVTK